MRRSRPNLGLREAPPGAPGELRPGRQGRGAARRLRAPGHPGTCGRTTPSARPAVPASALGELPGQARRQAAEQARQPVDGGEATAQLREAARTLPCPVADYAAPPEANRTGEPRD